MYTALPPEPKHSGYLLIMFYDKVHYSTSFILLKVIMLSFCLRESGGNLYFLSCFRIRVFEWPGKKRETNRFWTIKSPILILVLV